MSRPEARRGRYAFLTTGRWLRLIGAMVVVSVACVFLGMWQWGRYETRSAQAAQVAAAYDAEPVALTDLLPAPAGPVRAAEEWRPVQLTGHYAPGGTVLLRNRPVDGTPAVHVIAPFVARAGGEDVLVVVDRGWAAAEDGEAARADLPQPPPGDVTVTGRLRVAEQPFDRAAPTGQIYTLAPTQVLAGVATVTDLAEVAALPVLDGYVQAVSEDPAPQVALGGYTRPESSYGTNLSYAFQWWFFAAGALAAIVILARREAAENAGHAPVRRARSAEVEEDALVDAQLAAAPRPEDTPAADGAAAGQAGAGQAGTSVPAVDGDASTTPPADALPHRGSAANAAPAPGSPVRRG
ncbi:SURF1 family protein [Georgenia sp. SYP-B2076]|uniref:SURF1 family cytochrome oxidase biogenesis protein n=1 Tax=Georgenia sp. SYP-B2076 TaxID=2495881 RepID=UPI001F0C204C|nr:SURF1 family protein [Georgenia sp. SYP-B2076]